MRWELDKIVGELFQRIKNIKLIIEFFGDMI
jgi:hypothetical protein